MQAPDFRIAVKGPDLLTRRIVLARRDGAVTDPTVDELVTRLLAT